MKSVPPAVAGGSTMHPRFREYEMPIIDPPATAGGTDFNAKRSTKYTNLNRLMPSSTTVRVFETAEEVARAGAEQFVTLANDAVADHDGFTVALAGGNTPRRMYQLLAEDRFASRVDWKTVHVFFGDERCVPHNHPESNYRMVYESLISQVAIPASNVHQIAIEADPFLSAKRYESELRALFPDLEAPGFDLVLLGLGDDGHTASLFPETSALNAQEEWVVANWVEKLKAYRITLTAPAINGAANVTFLVVGAGKAPAVAEVLSGPAQPERFPAQLIKPEAGTLTWLLDSQAASRLTNHLAVHVSERPENDNKDQNG